MPLPKFTIDESTTIYELLGDVSGSELSPSVLSTAAVAFKSNVPEGMELKAHAKEPIAFGLNALVGDFLLDDAEGEMEKLEDSIKKVHGAGEIQVINISRQSVKMK